MASKSGGTSKPTGTPVANSAILSDSSDTDLSETVDEQTTPSTNSTVSSPGSTTLTAVSRPTPTNPNRRIESNRTPSQVGNTGVPSRQPNATSRGAKPSSSPSPPSPDSSTSSARVATPPALARQRAPAEQTQINPTERKASNTGTPSRQPHATNRSTRFTSSRSPPTASPPSRKVISPEPKGVSDDTSDSDGSAMDPPPESPVESPPSRPLVQGGAERGPTIKTQTKRESREAVIANVDDTSESEGEGHVNPVGSTDEDDSRPRLPLRSDALTGRSRQTQGQSGPAPAPAPAGRKNGQSSNTSGSSTSRRPLAPASSSASTTARDRAIRRAQKNDTSRNPPPSRTSSNRQPGLCDTITSCCTASCSACGWCWRWSGWLWIRAHLAYPVALLMSVMLVMIGVGTGPTLKAYGWWFCNVGDVDLGGSGYCESSDCRMTFVYTIPSIQGPIFESTQVLSALLLILSLGGLLSLMAFFYILFQYTFRQSCPQPHRALCCCRSLPEDPNPQLDQDTQRENQMSYITWTEQTPDDEKGRLRAEFRAKERLDWVVNILRLWGLIFGGLAWAWVGVVDGDDGLGLQALWSWFGLAILVWPVTRVLYRGSPRTVRRMARGGLVEMGSRAGGVSRNTNRPTRSTGSSGNGPYDRQTRRPNTSNRR